MRAKPGSIVVTGSGKPTRALGPRARLVIVVAGGVLLLAALAAGGWFAYQTWFANSESKIPESAAKTTINGKELTQTQKSQQAIYYGEYEQGQDLLKDQVKTAKTPEEKVNLYIQLATNAANNKKYDEAKDYAEQALAIKKDAGVYGALATIAVQQGNKTQAITYYEQQKTVLDPKELGYQQKLKNIDKYIAELKQ